MTDEMIINCSRWFHKYGISQLTYNIIGLRTSTARSRPSSNARIDPDHTIPNIFYPYPGTKLYDIAKEAGYLPDVIPPDCRVPSSRSSSPT
ncbi:MAG: hypothetical protein ACLUE4_09940 [Acutalibacteraceae bacterium]